MAESRGPGSGNRHPASILETVIPQNVGKKISPSRIGFLDKLDFPISPPALHGPLAAGVLGPVGMSCKIDQPANTITLCETFKQSLSVLEGPPRQIGGHANVKHAARATRHDVKPKTLREFNWHQRPLTSTGKTPALRTRRDRRWLRPGTQMAGLAGNCSRPLVAQCDDQRAGGTKTVWAVEQTVKYPRCVGQVAKLGLGSGHLWAHDGISRLPPNT